MYKQIQVENNREIERENKNVNIILFFSTTLSSNVYHPRQLFQTTIIDVLKCLNNAIDPYFI